MTPSIFANLPNDLILNIIKINTLNTKYEKEKIKNILNKSLNTISLIPFHYSPNYLPEYCKDKKVFYKVSSQFWDADNIEDDNGFNEEYETYSSDDDDY